MFCFQLGKLDLNISFHTESTWLETWLLTWDQCFIFRSDWIDVVTPGRWGCGEKNHALTALGRGESEIRNVDHLLCLMPTEGPIKKIRIFKCIHFKGCLFLCACMHMYFQEKYILNILIYQYVSIFRIYLYIGNKMLFFFFCLFLFSLWKHGQRRVKDVYKQNVLLFLDTLL